MGEGFQLHMIELCHCSLTGAPIFMQLYVGEEGQLRVFDPLPGWIGEVRRPHDPSCPDCRPFLADDCGNLDFGCEAASRAGHVHWPRWSRVTVGAAVEVELDGGTAEYVVHKVMRM